ncbi:MAG: VOC family protein, partial [Thermoleophilaceae bacterium]
MTQKITPNLWFDTEAQEAAAFYCEIFKSSRIVSVAHYPESSDKAGKVLTVEWELDGERFVGINGGPQFKFDEAVSFAISCADQDEVDYYWERLTDGGEESMCGWLKDKFGLSWQVSPIELIELTTDPDPGRAQRAMQAMLQQRRIDIAEIRRAADGVPA